MITGFFHRRNYFRVTDHECEMEIIYRYFFNIFAVVRKKNISLFLAITFTLTLIYVRASSAGQTEELSSSQKSQGCSFSSPVHSNSEMENVSSYNFAGFLNVKSPNKFTIFCEAITALLTRFITFTSPILNAAGYLHIKKYLSHNHPSHNFW